MKAKDVEQITLSLTNAEQLRYEAVLAQILTAQRAGDCRIKTDDLTGFKPVIRKLKRDGFRVSESALIEGQHTIIWGRAKRVEFFWKCFGIVLICFVLSLILSLLF